jgi:apolipoprotein N-acyltransferase
MALALAALFSAGAARLALLSEPPPEGDYRLRIVQPNIPQRDKIDPDKWSENFWSQVDLSAEAAPSGDGLFVIWPENGAPLLDEDEGALSVLSDALPKNALLLAGAVRRERRENDAPRYYNSVFAAAESGGKRRVIAAYDKHHLVPFGEYLPFFSILNAVGLAQLTPYGDAGFAAGPGPRTLEAGGTSFAPLICYEAIFPGALYPKGARPQWLLAVTNDAWFGDSSGPRQHLDQARLRSIESGLPMARSANTGISAVIDAKGRILARLRLYERGRIDLPLPPALPPTLYDRFGDGVYLLMSLFCLGAAWVLSRRTRP